MRINKQDTQGTKPLLSKGELGYDDYTAGGDVGRVYVGTSIENIPLAKSSDANMMTKAQFNALAEERKANRAGSGFDEWGKHYNSTQYQAYPINEGMYTYGGVNTFALGRGDGGSGVSKTVHPIVNIAGSTLIVKGINSSSAVVLNSIQLPTASNIYPYDTVLTTEQIASGVIKHADSSNSGLVVNGKGLSGTTFTQTITVVNGKKYIIEYKDNGVRKTLEVTASSTSYGISLSGTNITEVGMDPLDAISRSDLVFLESWHEGISEKNFVYPLGNVQYLGSNTDGLTGIANGAFTGFETYSLFGNWQTSSALIGKGYVWSSLTEAQKKAFIANPENNCYLDGDKVIQVRYRVRVVQGLGDVWGVNTNVSNFGNTEWGRWWNGLSGNRVPGTFPQGKSPVIPMAEPYLTAIHTGSTSLNGDLGIAISQNFAALSYTSRSYALPIALVHRRNQGMYHNVYNPNGTKLASDGLDCFRTTVSFTSISDCFNSAKLLTASGYIGTVSGRPDGLFYDQVHESDILDLRNSSKKVEDYNRLIKREFNKLAAGTNRGKEGEVQIFSNLNRVLSYGSFDGGINTRNYLINISDLPILPITLVNSIQMSYPVAMIIKSGVDIGKILVTRTYFRANSIYFALGNSSVLQEYPVRYTDGTIPSVLTGQTVDIYIAVPTTRTKSNTLLYCDIIGNPTNYPTPWKESGVFGTPLIVAEDGTSLLPDGVKDTFKLSRKANAAPLSVLRSKDNGLSWSKVSGETSVLTLLSTGGNIYAGTSPSGKIFKSDNGTDWKMVLETSETSITKIIKHSDGNFYAATSPSGKILKSTDGITWETVLDSTETAIVTLFSHTDGYVYAGTSPSGRIYRSNNSINWDLVLDTEDDHLRSIEKHTDGYLYASLGNNSTSGRNGKIYRSNDGLNWELRYTFTEIDIYQIISFGSYIYAGTGASGKIFRSNDGGTTWNEVYDIAGTQVLSFMVHTDGYLYAGTNDSGKIYRSNDGTTWSLAVDTTETHIYSLTSHTDGYIYAGTYPSGKIFRSNDGTTWNEVLKPYSFNTTLNEITLTDEPAANLVMVYYQTHTSMAVPVANSEVLGIGDVLCSDYHTTNNYLQQSLIGKINTNITLTGIINFTGNLSSYSTVNNALRTQAYDSPIEHKSIGLLQTYQPVVKVLPYLTRLNGKAYLNLVFKEMKYGSYAAPTVVTGASATYTINMTYKINIAGCALDGKVIQWTAATATSAIDWSLYDVSPTGVIYLLSTGVVYANAKLYDGDSWGDDNKFNIVDNVSTTLDDNGQTVLIGQKTVELPYFIGADE